TGDREVSTTGPDLITEPESAGSRHHNFVGIAEAGAPWPNDHPEVLTGSDPDTTLLVGVQYAGDQCHVARPAIPASDQEAKQPARDHVRPTVARHRGGVGGWRGGGLVGTHRLWSDDGERRS